MAILNLTTGIVFLKGWSGTVTGSTLAVDTLKLDSTNQDVILARDAANTLAQRNGTNAQTFIVYETTDGTNKSYLQVMAAAGGDFAFNAAVAGTGTQRGIAWKINGSTAFFVNGSKNLLWGTDNANDIGAGGANRPRDYYGAGMVQAGGATAFQTSGANGQAINVVQQLTEVTTIAAAASTDTTIQMPAGAVVLAVTVRTTTIIPTATSYSVGDSGLATRFNTANVGVAANSTDAGTKAGAYYNASALSVRLTMNGGTPAANTGRVRVTIYYYTVTPPTS